MLLKKIDYQRNNRFESIFKIYYKHFNIYKHFITNILVWNCVKII